MELRFVERLVISTPIKFVKIEGGTIVKILQYRTLGTGEPNDDRSEYTHYWSKWKDVPIVKMDG